MNATATATTVSVTDYQAETITKMMEKFGFFPSKKNLPDSMSEQKAADYKNQVIAGFVRDIRDRNSYFGQMYEYCNRMDGIRILISVSADNMLRDAFLSLDGAWSPISSAEVDEANATLARTL